MRVDKVGVHRTHCCIKHGCKYGDKDCPVVLGKVLQDYLCEDCNYFYDEFDDIKIFNDIKKLFQKKNRKYKINKINGNRFISDFYKQDARAREEKENETS